ncbi:MAG TPA: hypothetical protein VF808_16615 [Ktedonobacterales bacterium]
MSAVSATTGRGSSSLVRSITIAGLIIAIVGGFDQITFAVLTLQSTPVLVLQYIASAFMGPAAFAGGYTTALLGLLIHFALSFVVAAVFILAASRIALLRRTVFVSAPLYGAAVAVISGLVLPLTTAPKLPVTTLSVAHALVADAIVVGLPLAFAVWLGRPRAQG